MSKQYDAIGSRYAAFHELPLGQIQHPSTERVIGDVKGLKCLDLACGLGLWSKYLISQGASQVVGVDISAGMIEGARKAALDLPQEQNSRLNYLVADCSKPDLRVPGGPFDLVLGCWFLNYAPSYADLVNMFRAIGNNLKPGGRFVGVTTNAHCPMFETLDLRQYGFQVESLGTTEDGWKCRLTALLEPEPFSFEYHHMLHDKYEDAAREAEMGPIRWHGYVLPQDERLEQGFWDKYQLRGHVNILSCCKPPE
ncbi:hypothetical protein AC578_9043 [Pseudocercospora eumusae]|uniref:Methyltransferase domain-containing protein n=1 Tax=Pseudocercospora eumusae TaxID=321146 RepID=A0A139H8L0_9PEZI|nr:hypothetical protein AC578_9043 [Pseudocercospora eumusae]